MLPQYPFPLAVAQIVRICELLSSQLLVDLFVPLSNDMLDDFPDPQASILKSNSTVAFDLISSPVFCAPVSPRSLEPTPYTWSLVLAFTVEVSFSQYW